MGTIGPERIELVLRRTASAIASKWNTAVGGSLSDWERSTELSLSTRSVTVDPKKCSPIAGQVLVCNAAYGRRGWLGIASIWLTNGHISQATTKLNDSYHDHAPYNQAAWRSLVACQEIGHDWGLDHQDETFANRNLGTCMDYTNAPAGEFITASITDPATSIRTRTIMTS